MSRLAALSVCAALAGCGGEPPEAGVPQQQAPAPAETVRPAEPPPPKASRSEPIASHRMLTPLRMSPQLLRVEADSLALLLQATPRAAPDRPVILSRLGETQLELFFVTSAPGAGAEAKRLFGRMVADYPQHERAVRANYGLGLLHEQGQEPDLAARFYELAATTPGSRLVGLAHLGSGVALAASGRRAEAERAFRLALRELPEGTPAWHDARERLRAVK